jgi:DNA-binding CsgD family transcriptional regulator
MPQASPDVSKRQSESARANSLAHRNRIVGVAQRRESPRFVICDSAMQVLCASPGIERDFPLDEALGTLAPRCRESRASETVLLEAYDDDTVLRIVPLAGKFFGCVAIFIDAFAHRGSVAEAAKNFGLTKRESEVVPLILRGISNVDIAEALCVSECTIGDHVKSIMRKMNASKRIEIIGKVFNLDQDIAADVDFRPAAPSGMC